MISFICNCSPHNNVHIHNFHFLKEKRNRISPQQKEIISNFHFFFDFYESQTTFVTCVQKNWNCFHGIMKNSIDFIIKFNECRELFSKLESKISILNIQIHFYIQAKYIMIKTERMFRKHIFNIFRPKNIFNFPF